MRFVIVTGMSGAGKSTALKTFEDFGYFCVDNLPVPLIGKITEMMTDKSWNNDKVALGIDIRNGDALNDLSDVLAKLRKDKFVYEIMFLDASDMVLVKRYKETRRDHPLAPLGHLEEGIAEERNRISFLKERADYVIDTSMLLTRDLKSEIESIYQHDRNYNNIVVTIISFGFKFGIPAEADYVIDTRFLPNPYYDELLRKKTGNDKEVQDYVMADGEGSVFLNKLYDLMGYVIPQFVEKEGRHQMVVAVGCTGGRHRSVTIANLLRDRLSELPYSIHVLHRDISNDKYVKGEE
ncbi:MAG TPA: RNase adapter RapZ [Lachnospiraceae bacterium]|nr:RNase adapter RapZ [Lachnospiraceae bacterium]